MGKADRPLERLPPEPHATVLPSASPTAFIARRLIGETAMRLIGYVIGSGIRDCERNPPTPPASPMT
jgi:hypothetical protein